MARHTTTARIEQRRKSLHLPHNLGERTADAVAQFSGSWLFVGLHLCWFGAWLILRPEAFPFGLLTLLVSLEAIFLSTFVLMAQNRQWSRDHARDEVEAQEVSTLLALEESTAHMVQASADLLQQNTRLTEAVHLLTREIHAHVAESQKPAEPPPAP